MGEGENAVCALCCLASHLYPEPILLDFTLFMSDFWSFFNVSISKMARKVAFFQPLPVKFILRAIYQDVTSSPPRKQMRFVFVLFFFFSPPSFFSFELLVFDSFYSFYSFISCRDQFLEENLVFEQTLEDRMRAKKARKQLLWNTPL